MQVMYENVWLDLPLHLTGRVDSDDWRAEYLEHADEEHQEMGFSRFQLRTTRAAYAIGRLGNRWYRYGGFDLLADPTALNALVALDPSRRLLCIGRADKAPREQVKWGQVITRNTRMSASIDLLLTTLTARVQSAHFQ
jgi:hypothetical protein